MSNRDVIHTLLFIQCMHTFKPWLCVFVKPQYQVTNASKFEDLCMEFSLYLTVLIFLIFMVTEMLSCGHWEFCAMPFCNGLSNKEIMTVMTVSVS